MRFAARMFSRYRLRVWRIAHGDIKKIKKSEDQSELDGNCSRIVASAAISAYR